MPRIKQYSTFKDLDSYDVFLIDTNPFSEYFQLRELPNEFTGGKNGFLITGTEHLVLNSEVQVEVTDANGNPLYVEPGKGIPQYYEGVSKVVACYVYDDTPIGLGKIVILGELATYLDESGNVRPIPAQWQGNYNVKWSKRIHIDNVLPNETKVRFYKRPIMTVTEILKPVFERTTSQVVLGGDVSGVSLFPEPGIDYRTIRGEVLYRLNATSSFFTASMTDKVMTVSGLPGFNTAGTYETQIRRVESDTRAIARVPYYITSSTDNTQTITEFSNKPASITVESSPSFTDTEITGSFAKIELTRLNTFAGDPRRVRFSYKSLNKPGEFVVITDELLESTEILRNESSRDLSERTGYFFDQTHIDTYWTSSSLAGAPGVFDVTFDTSVLIDAARLSGSAESNTTGAARYVFETANQFQVGEDVEYTLKMDVIGIRPNTSENATLEVYASGSGFIGPNTTEHGILIERFSISGSTNGTYGNFPDVSTNIKALSDGSGSLKFVVYWGEWFLSDVSFKASQETSFSPDEATYYIPINADLSGETFIFRTEFFDINNNNIPVRVISDPITFNAGTVSSAASAQTLFLNADALIFQFNSSSLASPPNQSISMSVALSNLTGTITWTSQSWDINNNPITPAPALTTQNDAGATLTVADFSGSANNVQRVTYTATLGSFNDTVSIFRLQDSNPAQQYFLRTDKISFTFDGDTGLANPADQTSSISAFYQNIAGTTSWTVVNDQGTAVDPSFYTNFGNSLELYAGAFDPTTGSIFVSGALAGLEDSLQFYKTINGVIGESAPYGSFTIDGVLTFKSSSATGWETTSPTYITGSYYVGPTLVAEEIWQIDLNPSTKVLSASIVSADDPTITQYISGSGTPVLTFRLFSGSIQLNQTFDVVLDSGQGPAGQDGAFYTLEPQNISFNADPTGYVAPASFSAVVTTASIYAGNTQYQWSSSLGSQKFTIGTLLTDKVTVSQSNPTSPYIAITSMSENYGSVTVPLTYQDQYGNVSATAYPVIRYSKILDGQSGSDGPPGPTYNYIGDYYYVSSSNPTRPTNNNFQIKDVVSSGSSNILYYVFTGSDATQIGLTNDPTVGLPDWSALTSFDAVATDLVLATDIVVQKTIMMGLAASGSSDNITLKADTSNPYLSIGQSTKGYSQDGIFLGRDSGVSKFSLKGGTNGLTWDGTNLIVTGSFSALAGTIGGFTINTNDLTANNFVLNAANEKLSLGSGNNIVITSASEGFWVGHANRTSAPFSVDLSGNVTASSITITGGTGGGFDFGSDRLSVGTTPNIAGLYPGGDRPFFAGATSTAGAGAVFYVTNAGALNATNATISGNITATAGSIGGFTINSTNLTATNFVLDTSAQSLTLGSGNAVFVASASTGMWLGNAAFASAPFRVDTAGNLTATSATISGSINSTAGTIGGFTIGADSLTAANFILSASDSRMTLGSSNNVVIADANQGLWVGNAAYASAPFSVDLNGNVIATSFTGSGLGNIYSGSGYFDSLTVIGDDSQFGLTAETPTSNTYLIVGNNGATGGQPLASRQLTGTGSLSVTNIYAANYYDETGTLIPGASSTAWNLEVDGGLVEAIGNGDTVSFNAGAGISIGNGGSPGDRTITISTDATFLDDTSNIFRVLDGAGAVQQIASGSTLNFVEVGTNIDINFVGGELRFNVPNSGSMDNWSVDATTGGPTLISDSTTLSFVGSNGIATSLSGNTLTIDGAGVASSVTWNIDVDNSPPPGGPTISDGETLSFNGTPGEITVSHSLVGSEDTLTFALDGTFGTMDSFTFQSSGGSGIQGNTISNGETIRLEAGDSYIDINRATTSSPYTYRIFNLGVKAVAGTTNQIDVTGTTTKTFSLPSTIYLGAGDVNFGPSTSNRIFFDASPNRIDFHVGDASFADFRMSASGDFHVEGDVIAYSAQVSSDRRLKDNISLVSNALELIESLNGVKFTWKKNDKPSVGLIAQDVEKVLPELVSTTTSTKADEQHKVLNYNGMIGVLVEAVKELSQEVRDLRARVQELEGD